MPGIELRFHGCPNHRLGIILTELSCHLVKTAGSDELVGHVVFMANIYQLTLRHMTHHGYVNTDNRTILTQMFRYSEYMALCLIENVRDRSQ
jgi:hypothetical protein